MDNVQRSVYVVMIMPASLILWLLDQLLPLLLMLVRTFSLKSYLLQFHNKLDV